MQLIKLTCNNCNAQLDLDLEHLQANCPHCGQKLLLDVDQLGQILAEKEKTIRAINREAEITKRKRMQYEHESKETGKAWRREALGTVAAILGILAIFSFPECSHNIRVRQLQRLEFEIDEAIQQEDYDTALLRANKLYLDDNWSSEETKTWDVKREEYKEIIENKKREQDTKNPNNIFMPASSDSFNGKKYTDVVDQLKALGFTNVTTQVSSESAGLFKKSDTVEHILIGGKTKFTTEDYFAKDTPIIIYYYSK